MEYEAYGVGLFLPFLTTLEFSRKALFKNKIQWNKFEDLMNSEIPESGSKHPI